MPRKLETIEDYQAYVTELEKANNENATAKEGLEAKLSDYEKAETEYKNEINRLKIANYELFEKRTTVTNGSIEDSSSEEKKDEPTVSLDDVIKGF